MDQLENQNNELKLSRTLESAKTNEFVGSPLLDSFVNLFYYFGFVPFKTTIDKERGQYYLKTFTFQKIFCGVAHFVIIIYSLFILVFAAHQVFWSPQPTIVATMDFVSNAASSVSAFILVDIFWRKKAQFLEVIHCTCVSGLRHGTLIRCLVYLYFVKQCIFFGTLSYYMVNDNFQVLPLNEPNCTKVRGSNGEIRCENNEADSKNQDPVEWHNIAWRAFIMYASAFYNLTHGILIVLVPALYYMAMEFEHEMAKASPNVAGITKGLNLYQTLRKKTNLIRNLFGAHLLMIYVASVSYYAEAPHVLKGKRGSAEIGIFIFFSLTGVVWVLAAEFHYAVFSQVRKAVLTWVEMYTNVDTVGIENRLKLISISHEISIDPVALSSKCFSVTYTLISSMLGVIVTYAIIVLQLYHGPAAARGDCQ